MSSDLVFLLGGVSLLLAVVLPTVLRRAALSAPVVLIGVGALIGLLPMQGAFPKKAPASGLPVTGSITSSSSLIFLELNNE